MRIRRMVALAATAAIAFWTPSIVPVKATPGLIRCGGVGVYRTIDTAYAGAPLPCPWGGGHGSSPWPAVTGSS